MIPKNQKKMSSKYSKRHFFCVGLLLIAVAGKRAGNMGAAALVL